MTHPLLPQNALQESLATVYPHLSPGFRRVFRYLQAMSKKYRSVFPSLEEIADRCLLSTKQVQRAINKFIELGWLAKTKRAYQSCIYWLVDCLVKVNLGCRKFFEKPSFSEENVQQNVHVLGSYKEYDNIQSTSNQVPAEKAEDNEPASLQIPEPFKQMKRLTDQHRNVLASNFSEYELMKALDDITWYRNKGNTIECLFAFIWSRAKKIAYKMRGGI